MKTTATNRIAAALLSACVTTILFSALAVLFSVLDVDTGAPAARTTTVVASVSE